MWVYHTCKHSPQSRKFSLEIILRTLWFRNYPLITFCTRFRQLVLQFPVMFLVVPHFHALSFGLSFSGPAFSVHPIMRCPSCWPVTAETGTEITALHVGSCVALCRPSRLPRQPSRDSERKTECLIIYCCLSISASAWFCDFCRTVTKRNSFY